MTGPLAMTSAVSRSEELVAPPAGAVHIDPTALRDRLAAAIGSVGALGTPGPPLVVTESMIRRADAGPPAEAGSAEAFRWSPAMVRRSLGLAAVEACVAGRFHSPSEAVGPLVGRALAHWETTGLRRYHWEPWLAGLAGGGRAVVLAEAVGWASAVWSSFEWSILGPEVRFGGPFDQWAGPGARRVVVKARPEFRVLLGGALSVPVPGGGRRPGSALVSVRPGCPSAGWEEEAALVALASALRTGSGPLPVRVMGLWPEAGLHRCLDTDTGVLLRSVDRVAAAVAAAVDDRGGGLTVAGPAQGVA